MNRRRDRAQSVISIHDCLLKNDQLARVERYTLATGSKRGRAPRNTLKQSDGPGHHSKMGTHAQVLLGESVSFPTQ